MSGIDRTSSHIGASQATRAGNVAKAVGGAAFGIAQAGASTAAGLAGGSLARDSVNLAMDATRSAMTGGGGGGGSGSAIGGLTDKMDAGTDALNAQAGNSLGKAQQNQMELFMLQQSVNAQSQSFNTLTNVQKAKHDAAMAAIQNTR